MFVAGRVPLFDIVFIMTLHCICLVRDITSFANARFGCINVSADGTN